MYAERSTLESHRAYKMIVGPLWGLVCLWCEDRALEWYRSRKLYIWHPQLLRSGPWNSWPSYS